METHMSHIDDVNFIPPVRENIQPEFDPVEGEPTNNSQQQAQPYEFMLPHQYDRPPLPQQIYPIEQKKDIFTDIDKSVYIVIFIAFILGFFMGKTMQPVILRPM